MAHARRILLSAMAVLAFAGLGCAGANNTMPGPSAPIAVACRSGVNVSDFGLPERDGMVQMPASEQLSGKALATDLPDDRGGEGFRYTDSSCGIVPEDRDRR